MKLEHILVATDFSEAGRCAVAEAIAWAGRYRATLHLIHVVPPRRWFTGIFGGSDGLHQAACEQASRCLKNMAEGIDTARIPQISTGILEGTAARTINRAAQELDADLLVIGARGEHRQVVDWNSLGATAAKIVQRPVVPTLLVRREPGSAAPSVLAPVDLTAVSTSVLQWAFRCCPDGELRILHVYEIPFSARLRTYGIAESAIDVYAADENAKRNRELAALIQQASAPSTVRIQSDLQRVDSSDGLHEQIRHFTGTTLVLGKHLSDSDRTAPNYDSVCDYAARFCPTNVLVVPAAAMT